MSVEIREIKDENEIEKFLPVIINSFSTVSDEFGITKANAPTNPSFLTLGKLMEIHRKMKCFGLYYKDSPIGFFGLEKSDNSLIMLEKLAVLPDFRHKGYGKMILDYSINYARNNKFSCISAAIINMNRRLKNWYSAYGFSEVKVAVFPQLPFEVCFMEYTVR